MQKKKSRLLLYILVPLTLLILFFTFISVFEYTAVAELKESFARVDENQRLVYGETLFETRGCSGCHAINPGVRSLGPNLHGLSQIMPEDYIRQSIVSPGAIIVKGYEDIAMPNFGEILDARQVDALVEYIKQIN